MNSPQRAIRSAERDEQRGFQTLKYRARSGHQSLSGLVKGIDPKTAFARLRAKNARAR